jgi:hypothetical protein
MDNVKSAEGSDEAGIISQASGYILYILDPAGKDPFRSKQSGS